MTLPSRTLSLAVLCSGFLAISFGSIFVRLCDAPPLIIAAYRLLIATAVLAPFQFKTRLETAARIGRKEYVYYLLAGLFLALHFAAWIASLRYTSVASSVVLVTTNPLFVALFSWCFLREGVSRRAIIGIVLAVIGGFVVARADAGIGTGTLKGDALALAGAVMMGAYLLTGRRVRGGVRLAQYAFRVYGTAAILLIVYCLFTEPNWLHFSSKTYLFFVLSALVPQSIGHTSLNWGLRYFPAALVAVCTLFEPVGAALLALWFFHEALTAERMLGAVIILIGIYLSLGEARPVEVTS
jgi:drug/metabolite transporter (DMT)-like permease